MDGGGRGVCEGGSGGGAEGGPSPAAADPEQPRSAPRAPPAAGRRWAEPPRLSRPPTRSPRASCGSCS